MSKLIFYGEECRNGLKRGVDILANAVKVTFGAKGRYAALSQQFGSPSYTKDGLYVAKEVMTDDPLENEGIKTALEALNRTVKAVGDASTATCILTQAITEEGVKGVSIGWNPKELKKGMDLAVSHIVNNIKKFSVPVKGTMLKDIATISANNDEEIGQLIYEAMKRIGNEGLINMEDSKSEKTYVEYGEGVQVEAPLLSPYFITNPMTLESEQSNPLIMICNCKITNFNEVIPALNIAIEEKRELLIIATDIDQNVVAALVNNRRTEGGVRSVALLAPGFGENRAHLLEDIAIVTGGQVVSEDLNMNPKDITLSMMGSADKVIAGGMETKIVGGKGSTKNIKERVSKIKAALKVESEEFQKKRYRERIAKLVGGVATIFVGAPTPAEQGELKDRIEDSLEAVKAAISEGVVLGGGTTLLRAAIGLEKIKTSSDDELAGVKIIQRAIEAPIRQLLSNAGVDASLVVGKIKESGCTIGYNVKTDEYEDLLKTGVIDPAKSVRVALEYSTSTASMIMTTECIIIDKPKTNTEVNTGGGLF